MLGNAAAPGAAWCGNSQGSLLYSYTHFRQHSCPFKACSDKAPKLQPFVRRIVRSQKPSVQGTSLSYTIVNGLSAHDTTWDGFCGNFRIRECDSDLVTER